MSEGTPIDSLPEWPADRPFPEDAVTVYGASTVEEACEYLQRLREAEVRRQSALEADQRLRRERHAAEAQQRAAVFEGLARLGRGDQGASDVVNRRGVAPPKDKTIRAAAAAGILAQRMIDAEQDDEVVDLEDAAQVVLEDLRLLGRIKVSTVLTHYRVLRRDPSYNPS
jgi:hypothetical protein